MINIFIRTSRMKQLGRSSPCISSQSNREIWNASYARDNLRLLPITAIISCAFITKLSIPNTNHIYSLNPNTINGNWHTISTYPYSLKSMITLSNTTVRAKMTKRWACVIWLTTFWRNTTEFHRYTASINDFHTSYIIQEILFSKNKVFIHHSI